jgi:hypothetical protein
MDRMANEHFVENVNLSIAWGRALTLASARGRSEIAPLIVTVTGFGENGDFGEEPRIRAALDEVLLALGKQSVDTVANTIFPSSLWNPLVDRNQLYQRYRRLLPRIHRASHKNSRGTYFERMITGGPSRHENQLEFAISAYLSRSGVRRSIFQIAVFDPCRDHSAAAQLGFPCLQHVTFAPTREGLCLNAFYATQYIVERVYGNYVGLCRLGKFIAHEIGLPLVRFTCFTGIAECETPKDRLRILLKTIDEVATK